VFQRRKVGGMEERGGRGVGGGAIRRRLREDSSCEEGWPRDVAVTCTKDNGKPGVKEGGEAESLLSPVVLHHVLLPHVPFASFSVHISLCLHLIGSQRLPDTVFLPVPTPSTPPKRSVATPEANHPSPLAPPTQRGESRPRRDPLRIQPTHPAK